MFFFNNPYKMTRTYKSIFVTVGTTRFDDLCEVIKSIPVVELLKGMGCEEITLQAGNSDVVSSGSTKILDVPLHVYDFKDSLKEDIDKADLIISHAGAGSCLEALEAGKPLLVVINDSLMDNHQVELAEQLHVDGHLFYCTPCTLESTLQEVDFSLLLPYPKSDSTVFMQYLDSIFKVKLHSS